MFRLVGGLELELVPESTMRSYMGTSGSGHEMFVTWPWVISINGGAFQRKGLRSMDPPVDVVVVRDVIVESDGLSSAYSNETHEPVGMGLSLGWFPSKFCKKRSFCSVCSVEPHTGRVFDAVIR